MHQIEITDISNAEIVGDCNNAMIVGYASRQSALCDMCGTVMPPEIDDRKGWFTALIGRYAFHACPVHFQVNGKWRGPSKALHDAYTEFVEKALGRAPAIERRSPR